MPSRTKKRAATKSSPRAATRALPVVLIDDNRLLRDGLSTLLSAQGLKVVATARSGEEALREVARVKPQLVLLDSALGDREGPRFVQEMRQNFPDVKLIVMGLLPAAGEFVEFIKAGVAGFILKDATIEVFVATIMAVADGAYVLPTPLTHTLFTHVAAQARSRGKRGAKAAVRMTALERQVIESISDGLGNKEIAERLHMATHTVKSHVHNILEKLALHTRLEVAAYAHEEGEQPRPFDTTTISAARPFELLMSSDRRRAPPSSP
jgi:DNA-binding NarL/FixJ family response regulator